ncbi:acyl-CoA dehydrogenase family protein [Chloroflexota bacterium]
MDFDLTEEQQLLRNTARDFLSSEFPSDIVKEMAESETGYSPELWRKMAELGWLGLAIPEEYEGMGMGFMDLAILLEEMGRACYSGPFFSTSLLGASTILDAGSEAQKKELLPRIASGDLIVALALTESSVAYEPWGVQLTAVSDDDDFVLNGTKLFVENATVADLIITVACTKEGNDKDGISLFLVHPKSQGVNPSLQNTVVGDKQCEVVYDNVRIPASDVLGALNEGWPVVEGAIERATAALCAYMVGGAQKTLEMSTTYAKERHQFGQPIGAFQVIQHYCADMMIDVDACRFLMCQAVWKVSEGLPATLEVSMAKSFIGETYRKLTLTGHRIHGGIGFCMDHDMPLYFKRSWSAEPTFGDSSYHRERVANLIGL